MAVRSATDVLAARPADRAETGVAYAQLAMIWAQVARGELDDARQRFDSLSARSDHDPGLAAAVWLTGTRLAAVVGDPRLVRAAWPFDQSVAKTGWFGQQLRLARAEAELISGRPNRALEILQNEERPCADVSELRARAWLQLGDLGAVTATLRERPVEPVSALTQVQLELIEARLAHIRGDSTARRALIDRVLRTAGRERLRTPITWAKEWLHTVVITEPELLRLHGGYLASIPTTTTAVAVPNPNEPIHAGALELSERELEILQRLGSLSTNREIAAELFLSTNTVKTHLKSLYRKLEVARRSEAFRRGRALGLC